MEEHTMNDSTQPEKKERKDVYGPLSEAFPQEMERTLNKGGTNLTYIPVSEVINRMNKVLGVENWSFSIKGYTEIGDSIVAHVTVVTTIDGKEVSRDGVGGQKIKRIKATGLAVDYGDEVKGAVSDALKKAVQTLGVGLYLARSDEAIEIEMAMDAPVDESTQVWESFVSVSKGLDESKRSQLNEFWASISSNAPKPRRPNDATLNQLQDLLTEATRLSFQK
jgi:hypothetical protein